MRRILRNYQTRDAREIWQLNNDELGYSFSYEETLTKLERLSQEASHCLLVAEIDGKVVGYIHGNDYEVVYMPSFKNIMGLAVAKEYQNQGIGKALLTALEEWAKDTGAKGVRLVSGGERLAAHQFYERCGYQKKKMQANFRKEF